MQEAQEEVALTPVLADNIVPDYNINLKQYASFVRRTIKPQVLTVTETELHVLDLSNAFGGEAGELQNVIKKIIHEHVICEDHQLLDKFVEEAGDSMWYLFALIQKMGYNVEYILLKNREKLTARRKAELEKEQAIQQPTATA
jgi:NTP pyrophosphatase (non-canonical NTP hydrolase)